ncbi:MAG: STAS domain-containing protein [Chitinivibrionales bacterium]|nr:STAS domain-containing protein [Chitinivibrionales bacterium]
MLIESTYIHGYQLLKIKKELNLNSDLTELRQIIEEYVEKGPINIALKFTDDSYLYTKSIASLVQSFEMVRDHGGKMAVINPNEDIIEVLNTVGFTDLVKICKNEEELAKV